MSRSRNRSEDEKRQRAERLRKRVADLKKPSPGQAERRPGESDAAYVHRRMRELDRKPRKPSGS